MDYLWSTHYIIVALASALELKAVWHLNRREVSVKQIFLYKHLRDVYFSSIPSALSVSWEGEYCMNGALGSVTHLPAMLPCSFEDHLSVASLKCFLQRRAVAALCELTIETVLEIRVSILRRPTARPVSKKTMEWGVNHKRPTFVNSRERVKKRKEQKWFAFLAPGLALCRFSFARSLVLFTFQPSLITSLCESGNDRFPGKNSALTNKEFTTLTKYVVEIRPCKEIRI